MRVKCVIFCLNCVGQPDVTFCIVECAVHEYELGLHYDAAAEWCDDQGYEAPYVVFDEYDQQAVYLELMSKMDWDTASIVHASYST